jgi:hypothetical protein
MIVAMSSIVTSPQLYQVNTTTGNKKISQVPPGFEVSRTPLANPPICCILTMTMSSIVISAQLNEVNTPIGNNKID